MRPGRRSPSASSSTTFWRCFPARRRPTHQPLPHPGWREGGRPRRGVAGACVPVETDGGDLVIALLDYDHQCLICAIGKSQGWYYALDAAWQPLAQGQFIDDVLAVLPGALEAHRPAAANAC